jgi:purine-nucleoside phosphorylase
MLDGLKEALAHLKKRVDRVPSIGIVLGSGLGGLASRLDQAPLQVPGSEIPNYPRSTVTGHQGSLVFGRLGGVDVALQSGRVHMYEGYSAQEVVFPVRLMALLGVRTFLLTNACGGIAAQLDPGDLVVLRDHMNLTGRNPLVGLHDEELGPRFPDMTHAYSPALRKLALEIAAERGLTLREGVYAALLGPSYETPAEIRMLATLGADVVGMSTVPEVIALGQLGREVLTLSCVTNKAAGLSGGPLSHEEVMQTGLKAQATLTALVTELVRRIAARQ